MRFRPNGPDVPDELVALQEKGEVIFICGAGVSRSIGLPDFRELVTRIYAELGEDWNRHPAEREVMQEEGRLAGQYDRCLRSLERRLAASDLPRNRGMRKRMRTAVRNALVVPADASLDYHLALLELSRDAEGQSRLITTNFDTLFERAWFKKHQQIIASHAHAAMPSPRVSGFEGILHLHGRIEDNQYELGLFETDLVLTSSEFGEAYLRSGWASRYVYDVVRAYTVVLVGYSADDPPMRYLLEVLEADRERYQDLHHVYAFAECKGGDEELESSLWRAKGVEPILYRAESGDHSVLYDTLREWRDYSNDPTAWRREELRRIFASAPKEHEAEGLGRCAALLRHGDAAQLLGELSPSPDWISPLIDRRVFGESGAHAGRWIAARLDDADMIRASIALPQFGDEATWYVERAIEQNRERLSSVRLKAWQLILRSKRQRLPRRHSANWYYVSQYLSQGDADHDGRQIVRKVLQPRLKVEKVLRLSESPDAQEERLSDLLRIDFEPDEHAPTNEILSRWPQNLDQEMALFRVLERALSEALEEASDLGWLTGWDRANGDVPSIALHPQNAYREGFYPIVRVLADLWMRISSRDRETARVLMSGWYGSPYLLVRRLYLFAMCSQEAFSSQETWAALKALDDEAFWLGGAQVEVMRLATLRWREFTSRQRQAFEARIRNGLPRALFPDDAFGAADEWNSVNDSAVMKRLARLESVGWPLTRQSEKLLRKIQTRHPGWTLGQGDRDDFSVWHESHSGPSGEPDMLAGIADNALVAEAMRLQRERPWEQGDVWRMFCAADPERAQQGLHLEAQAGRWEASAWCDFIWAATEKGDVALQLDLAASLLAMPEPVLIQVLPAACRWLEQRYQLLKSDASGGFNFLALWDRFADVAYPSNSPLADVDDHRLFERALNEPAGVLAQTLLRHIDEGKPPPGTGLTAEQSDRLTRIVGSDGEPGLLARAILCRFMAYLDGLDPNFVSARLVPLLNWDQPHAAAMWHARAFDGVGSARLFSALKAPMLQAFRQPGMSDNELEALMGQLLMAAFAHRRGEMSDYDLTNVEIKGALAAGSDNLRAHVAWQFWRAMGDATGEPQDKASRWEEFVGPVFGELWPLDAVLRSEAISRNLVLMTLECGEAFSNAVEAVIDIVVPYELYLVAHSLRLETEHDALVRRFPRAAIRLANAIIDPDKYPVPSDLSEFLQVCADADPSVVSEAAYVRLFGLRRQRAA